MVHANNKWPYPNIYVLAMCPMQAHLSGNYIPTVISSLNYTSLSSTVEILLFNSVFHNRVNPVSVSTLKSPLGVIEVLPLKSQVSPILFVLYIRLVVTL